RGEGTGAGAATAVDSAAATPVGVFREVEGSGTVTSVADRSPTGTAARESSSSRTSTIPITGTTRTIPATRTPRTATRIHPRTPLNTATGTVRRTAVLRRPHDRPSRPDARRRRVRRRTRRRRGGFVRKGSERGDLPAVPSGMQRSQGAGGSRRRHLQRRTARVHD